ncbi:hypothetical protein PGIGA_G00041740, partial [Pangasianodon gigas]|nr:hypothetical protein [Pangasianodon gigas]
CVCVCIHSEDGYLYEREAILEYILHQKTEIAKKMKAYEKQKKALRSEGQLESGSEEREKIEKFKNKESSIVSKPINPFITGQSKDAASSPSGSASSLSSLSSLSSASASTESTSSSSLPSFWIPSLTPEAKPTLLKKPVSEFYSG